MFTRFRKSAAIVLTSVVAVSTVLSASAESTPKSLSSNFTLVNLQNGPNDGQISYVKPGGEQWKSPDTFTFNALGDQKIYRQYQEGNGLTPGSGSVVVSTNGPVGAVVQIQARDGQVPTSGAYVGVSEGAQNANVPLVSRRGTAAGNNRTNSQIIIQNASSISIDVDVVFLDLGSGNAIFTKTFTGIAPNASQEYDLDDEGNLPEGWFGSASIQSKTAGGEVAVVSNFFLGPDAMQTFNAFTKVGDQWVAPSVFSRLSNGLSSPITVQNVSGGDIQVGDIDVKCTKDPGSPAAEAELNFSNKGVLKNNQAVAFNPVTDDETFPDEWFGSCRVNSNGHNTAMFVQLRFVREQRAAAYEGILADSTVTNKRVVVPLFAKRLAGANLFSSAITIANLSATAPANVTLVYKKSTPELPANCDFTTTTVIPANGSLIQNLRTVGGVPDIGADCTGSLTVTSSDQPIDAFVQLDFLSQTTGDPYMAHNAFSVPTE